MRAIRTWAMALALLGLLSACASPRPLGSSARAWTDLQRSNTAALGWARPLPGDAADRIYQRYLNSFGQPIPDNFGRKSFSAE